MRLCTGKGARRGLGLVPVNLDCCRTQDALATFEARRHFQWRLLDVCSFLRLCVCVFVVWCLLGEMQAPRAVGLCHGCKHPRSPPQIHATYLHIFKVLASNRTTLVFKLRKEDRSKVILDRLLQLRIMRTRSKLLERHREPLSIVSLNGAPQMPQGRRFAVIRSR